MDPITVLLWLWNGWRPVYDFKHVNASLSMLDEHMDVPYKPVCITDNPAGIQCETFPIWDIEFRIHGFEKALPIRQPRAMPRGMRLKARPLKMRPNSYRRLKVFSEWGAEQWPGKVLSIDLDAVICKKMSPLITDHDFRINKGKAAPYNGAMWMLRTGTRRQAWDQFSSQALRQTTARRWVGSDQAWLSLVLPGEATWGKEDGIYHYSQTAIVEDMSACRIMFTAGVTKPWHPMFAQRFPTLHKQYMRHFK